MFELDELWNEWLNGPLQPADRLVFGLPLYWWARVAIATQVFAIAALLLEFIPKKRRHELALGCRKMVVWLAPKRQLFKAMVYADWFLAWTALRFAFLWPFLGDRELHSYLSERGKGREDYDGLRFRQRVYHDIIEVPVHFVWSITLGLHIIGLVIALAVAAFSEATFFPLASSSFAGVEYDALLLTGLLILGGIVWPTILHLLMFAAALLSPIWLALSSAFGVLIVKQVAAFMSARHYTRVVTGTLLISASAALFLSLLTS